jgi:hypothetical protein
MDGQQWVVMEITEESDIETVESSWPATERDLFVYKPGSIWLKEDGVCTERGYTAARGKTYELSPVNRKKGQSVVRT